MSALSRRQVFLSGAVVAGAAALPAAIARAGSPEAALIATCAEFGRLSAATNKAWNSAITDAECEAVESLTEPLHDKQEELLDIIVETPATTLEGVRARALALAQYEPEIVDPYGYGADGWNDHIARAVIRDLLALTGGAA